MGCTIGSSGNLGVAGCFPNGDGAVVLAECRAPLWVAAVIVGFFALFHGHAHGTELSPGSSSLLYSIGFVIATGLVGARQGMIMMQSRIGDSGRSCILSI